MPDSPYPLHRRNYLAACQKIIANRAGPDLSLRAVREARRPRKGPSPLAVLPLVIPDFQPKPLRTGHMEERHPMAARLPLLPHPGHLRKQAKARLAAMRRAAPSTRLAEAQGLIAREYGFPDRSEERRVG